MSTIIMVEFLINVTRSSGVTGFDGILGYIRRYLLIALLIFPVSIGPIDLTQGTSTFFIFEASVPEPPVRKPLPRYLRCYPRRDRHCVCPRTDWFPRGWSFFSADDDESNSEW